MTMNSDGSNVQQFSQLNRRRWRQLVSRRTHDRVPSNFGCVRAPTRSTRRGSTSWSIRSDHEQRLHRRLAELVPDGSSWSSEPRQQLDIYVNTRIATARTRRGSPSMPLRASRPGHRTASKIVFVGARGTDRRDLRDERRRHRADPGDRRCAGRLLARLAADTESAARLLGGPGDAGLVVAARPQLSRRLPGRCDRSRWRRAHAHDRRRHAGRTAAGTGRPHFPDAILSDDGSVLRLRAENRRRGDGRVYRIAFTASDGRGGACSGTASVEVPRHRGRAGGRLRTAQLRLARRLAARRH